MTREQAQALERVAQAAAVYETQGHILAEAIRQAWRLGCTRRAIADRAGLARSTLYRRFGA